MSVLSLQQLLNTALLFLYMGRWCPLCVFVSQGNLECCAFLGQKETDKTSSGLIPRGKNMYPLRKYGGQDAYMRQGSLGGDGPGKGYSDNGSRIKLSP